MNAKSKNNGPVPHFFEMGFKTLKDFFLKIKTTFSLGAHIRKGAGFTQ